MVDWFDGPVSAWRGSPTESVRHRSGGQAVRGVSVSFVP